jgi:ABC-2 type transport system ATP-binding protein
MTDGIAVENLHKTYRRGLGATRITALDGVSLEIRAGETFGIIGPNGAGKTTLLGCLLGFLRPDAGQVTVGGRAPDDLAIRATTGYMPERLVLDRWMTGRGFLVYHHNLAGLSAATRTQDIAAALASVELTEAGDRRVAQYSRGMLQRLGIAQALLGEPGFLFLDEPASGVDPTGVLLFRRLIAGLRDRGATVVINSHQLDQVERVCDRVAFVSRGKVEAVETVHAGATEARVLRVRSAGHAIGGRFDRERLAEIATAAGATLLDVVPPAARFSVVDDDGAARLLGALLAAGVPVAEATPEEGRLERLFMRDAATKP